MSSKTAEALKAMARKIVPETLKRGLFRGGYALMSDRQRDETRRAFQIASVESSLRNMRALGFRPAQIVDVGAYIGGWTKMVKSIFPEAKVLMIEAQTRRENDLRQVCAQFQGDVTYQISLLGAESRNRVQFYELETGSSVMFEQSSIPRSTAEYPMRPLDSVSREAGFEKVDFLKLDVQGYELEVLKGAQSTLQNAQAVLMEVSLMGVNKGAPLVNEVLQFMAERNFRVYDICSFIRRPLDNALWQSDLIFLRADSALLSNESFN